MVTYKILDTVEKSNNSWSYEGMFYFTENDKVVKTLSFGSHLSGNLKTENEIKPLVIVAFEKKKAELESEPEKETITLTGAEFVAEFVKEYT